MRIRSAPWRLSAAIVVALAAVSLTWPLHATPPQAVPSPAAGTQVPRRFVIDSHQHWRAGDDYIAALVETYRPRNAMACVLTPFRGLEAVRQAAAQYPDVVIPYGHIRVDDPDALAQVSAFAAAGFKGVKMHTPRHNWDDFGYFPIYQRMQDLSLVALFHTGIVSGSSDEPEPSSMARMRPGYLHTIARSFPKLRIQGAHLGNPWYDEAGEVARWEKNVHFDVTGSTLIKKQRNLAVFSEYLWWEGPTAHSSPDAVYAFEKLVFGTDEPPAQLDNMLGRYEAMLEANDVPEASRRKIYGETMARILGIEVRP